MRHYEICFIVHPDQSEQVPAMIDRYKAMIANGQGGDPSGRRLGPTPAGLSDRQAGQSALRAAEHRVRQQATLDELEHAFRYNDAVLRHLTVKTKRAETGASPMMKIVEQEEAQQGCLPSRLRADASAGAAQCGHAGG